MSDINITEWAVEPGKSEYPEYTVTLTAYSDEGDVRELHFTREQVTALRDHLTALLGDGDKNGARIVTIEAGDASAPKPEYSDAWTDNDAGKGE